MKILSEKNRKDVFKELKDETRLAIFICLSINPNLTVRELSLYLNRGKTTINHHLGKLAKAGVVKWREKDEDKKSLKTRFFSLNEEVLKEIYSLSHDDVVENLREKKRRKIEERVKFQASITDNLLNWVTEYIKDAELSDDPNLFIKRINLTPVKLELYQEREKEIEELESKEELNNITHIATHILIPIKDIFEWKKSIKE